MKLKVLVKSVMAFAVVFFTSGAPLHAEESPQATQSHEQHHPEGQAKNISKDSGMMGSMKMEDMMGMMHECMEMHKDSKMCDGQMMDSCQKNMGKGECQKMMKQAKAKQKAEKKK